MNILIISEHCTKETFSNAPQNVFIECMNWNSGKIESSFNEFHIVIIDLNYSTRTNFNAIKDLYLDIENKLNKDYLEEDGIIFVMICGCEHKEIFDYKSDDKNEIGKSTYELIKKIDQDTYEIIDFMPKGTKFLNPTDSIFYDYLTNVNSFVVTLRVPINPPPLFDRISPKAKTAGAGNVYIVFERRVGNGIIIYLPGYDINMKQSAFEALLSICDIYFEKQQSIRDKIQKDSFKTFIPEWVNKYKVTRHKAIPLEIGKLMEEQDYFDKVCFLLYGKDKELEDVVKLVLEDIGMKVDKSATGESIDLICTFANPPINIFIEVTGTAHSINLNSSERKVTQVMTYKTSYPDKKVILLANTFCNLDLDERKRMENFAERVEKSLTLLEILMLTTVDLFFLWKLVYEKRISTVDALQLIQEQKGIFKFPEGLL